MAQFLSNSDISSLRSELAEVGTSLRSSFRRQTSSFRSAASGISSANDDEVDEEFLLQWAAIERLPTYDRLKSSLFDGSNDDGTAKRVVDVTKIGAAERHLFIEKLIKHTEKDNLRLLQKLRKRSDNVGVELPKVEVRYNNLRVEAECQVVRGKPLPTLWNSLKSTLTDFARVPGLSSQEAKIVIVKDASGILKPGRMTLLLGPPGCGKTTLLKALSGNLSESLKVTGEVTYNGYALEEFVPQKTSAYISQTDLHIPEMTVRETLDFSARCQGVGSRADFMAEISRREKQAGIVPDPDIDTYMKAVSVEGHKTSLQTDYSLKILGLGMCADTMIGDAMRTSISGGQKKRVSTGEMIVGPTKALFMDEISNGLDSSTTYQIVSCLQHLSHISDATIFVALLQPAPETYDLFDDIVLMAEGKIIYHGPRSDILKFFEDCGFRCPERKGVADFLQEVISRKDQAQYWKESEHTHQYISVDALSTKFKESQLGKKLYGELSEPFVKSESHKDAISFNKFSLPKWLLFKACMSREFLLMKRNIAIYVFKSVQLTIVAFIVMTIYLRTEMGVDVAHANSYLGALFYALIVLFFDGLPELAMTVGRLEGFYKQRDLYFYPAWAYAIPSSILKIPLSLLEALIWTCLTYYVIGFSPEAERFFRQFILLAAMHLAGISLFRFVASVCRTMVASTTIGSLATMFVFLFSGFVIPRPSMPVWLKWGFWLSPMTYGELGVAVNEFRAPRWQKAGPGNVTIGEETLESHGFNFEEYFFWISIGSLVGFTILFNFGFTMALTFMKPPGSRAIISNEKLSEINGVEDSEANSTSPDADRKLHQGKMVLPFEPMSMTFKDVQYYVDTPPAMRERGFTQKKLRLLCDITGALRPGVLTALMGVSGAGKTTLLDVLAGRKTSGTIEGDIRVGGYPKVQETFARISGYCEQTDIHSPQITVQESAVFSAWLRLDPQIDAKTKSDFVKEVLETIELDDIKDSLVGIPGVSGLSTEQRKRLTIAVELVANPSIVFMDEPTTGLDARAAAIVMRAVKNVGDTGRTIVCTIHQPSIHIFEAFDELILLKTGGRITYSGPLGPQSSSIIKYFEGISGVPKIKNNYNPATWVLDVTSTSSESDLGLDFAEVFKNSVVHRNNQELVERLRTPAPGSSSLHFPTRFAQNSWEQFKLCLWKQYLSYWRSPSYNLVRSLYALITCVLLGALFWDEGTKMGLLWEIESGGDFVSKNASYRHDQQSLFNVFGSMYSGALFLGINNCSSLLPYVSMERTVLYRERFAGMYGSWAYSLAQIIIEIPYLLAQAFAYMVITYPMIGYYWSASKFFWSFYAIFSLMVYCTYLGMLLIAMTPSFLVAAILQSVLYALLSLFAGFLIPGPQIPKWWKWLFYLTPMSWTLEAMLTSQYGDINTEIVVFGEKKTVKGFLSGYFGFDSDRLPLVGVMLAVFPIAFALLFAFCIQKLNFQKR